MPNRSEEREEFLSSLLNDGMSTGYSWFQYSRIKRNADGYIVSAHVAELNDDETGYEPRGIVDIETVARGFALLRKGPIEYLSEDYRARLITVDRTNGDYDANDADVILQLGILSQLKYA